MVVFSLTLVRHGETTANKDGVIQGHQDVRLSDVGLEQARLVALRLQNENFTHIFASDLSRAAQTAQIIAEASSVCQCSVQLDKRLRERKFGEFEGKTFKDLFAAAQKHNKKWADFTPDGAETYEEVRFRAQAFFRELCETMAKTELPVDGTYIPTSFLVRHPVNAGLSNGTAFVMDAESPDKLLPSREKKTDCGATTVSSQLGPGHPHTVEEGVASKRPRIEDTQLHRLSLEGVGSPPDVERDCVLAGMQGTGATTMARSNSSSSSGCSSLHDSVECAEGDVELPSQEEERDSGSTPTENRPGNAKASVCVLTQLHPAERAPSSSAGQLPAKCLRDGWQPWFRDTDASPVFGSSVVPSLQACPNVSLSPLLEHRLTSMSSVSSGRNSSFDDADIVPAVAGEVLVVSHGGLIKELMKHFIEDFNCKVPGGKGHAMRVCPNTGVSRFMVTLSELDWQPTVTCLLIHDKDHLKSLQEPLPEPTPAV